MCRSEDGGEVIRSSQVQFLPCLTEGELKLVQLGDS
jgi:hypothetical protein